MAGAGWADGCDSRIPADVLDDPHPAPRGRAGRARAVAAAVAGSKSSAWIIVVALAGHGVFDAVHGQLIENAGVPAWWPAWCLAYDVGAAAGLAWLLQHGLVANHVRP